MKKAAFLAAICVPALLAAAPLSAKTLVYCSEGSPENFYPGREHHRHLVRRQRARSTTASSSSSAAGPRSSRASPRSGTSRRTARSIPSTCARTPSGTRTSDFKPTRTCQRGRRHVHVRAAVEGGATPSSRSRARTTPTSTTWACRSSSSPWRRSTTTPSGSRSTSPRRRSCRTWPWSGRASSRRNTPTRC